MPSVAKRLKNLFRKKPSGRTADPAPELAPEDHGSNEQLREALDEHHHNERRTRHRKRHRRHHRRHRADDARSEATSEAPGHAEPGFLDALGADELDWLNASEEASEDEVDWLNASEEASEDTFEQAPAPSEQAPVAVANDADRSEDEGPSEASPVEVGLSSVAVPTFELQGLDEEVIDAFYAFDPNQDQSEDQDQDDVSVGGDVADVAQAFATALGTRRMMIEAVDMFLEFDLDELYEWTDIRPWGWQEQAFWPDETDTWVMSRDYGLQVLGAKMATICLTKPVDDADDLADYLFGALSKVPVDFDEAYDYALVHGLVEENALGEPEVATAGIGTIARMAADADTEALDKGRYSVDRSDAGYATIGMDLHHGGMDKKDGQQVVKYNETDEEREPTVLTMVGGEFQYAIDGTVVENPSLEGKTDTEIWDTSPNFATLRQAELKKQGMSQKEATQRAIEEIRSSPRLIFAMDSEGTFYAAQGKLGEIHHSTFLAGKEVACAGEMGLSGGKPVFISNASGHYIPGPAFMWQAVHALANAGADVALLDVEMYGVPSTVKGDWLLKRFVPGVSLSMKSDVAVEQVKSALGSEGDAEIPGLGGSVVPEIDLSKASTGQVEEEEVLGYASMDMMMDFDSFF